MTHLRASEPGGNTALGVWVGGGVCRGVGGRWRCVWLRVGVEIGVGGDGGGYVYRGVESGLTALWVQGLLRSPSQTKAVMEGA